MVALAPCEVPITIEPARIPGAAPGAEKVTENNFVAPGAIAVEAEWLFPE